MNYKAIIFDYIGTLVNCRGYNLTESENKLFSALAAEGFQLTKNSFLDAYHIAHLKYRRVRYEEFKEITNAVWVAEALCSLGYKVTSEDECIKSALNLFFQDFIDTLELRQGAKQLLAAAASQTKIGLISNFTHAPVIHKSLRKVGIHQYFNAIVISEEIGCRKPCSKIFEEVLERLQVKAAETIFIGDSPIEDIKGAKEVGLKTIFVPSQFNSIKYLQESKQEPNVTVNDLCEVLENLANL